MSLRSKSPDDNSSLLSASSLDSALNHSREEEELRGLTMDQCYDDQCSNDEIEKVLSHSKFIFFFVGSFGSNFFQNGIISLFIAVP